MTPCFIFYSCRKYINDLVSSGKVKYQPYHEGLVLKIASTKRWIFYTGTVMTLTCRCISSKQHTWRDRNSHAMWHARKYFILCKRSLYSLNPRGTHSWHQANVQKVRQLLAGNYTSLHLCKSIWGGRAGFWRILRAGFNSLKAKLIYMSEICVCILIGIAGGLLY